MILNLTIHDSWAAHPGPLSRLLAHLAALEQPAPWTPPVVREPGDDADDLAELLAGMDDAPEAFAAAPQPAAAPARTPAPQPQPAMPRFSGEPTTGQSLYKWACQSKVLPRVNAIGKARGWHKLVTHWTEDQVREAYATLTAEPAPNGRPH